MRFLAHCVPFIWFMQLRVPLCVVLQFTLLRIFIAGHSQELCEDTDESCGNFLAEIDAFEHKDSAASLSLLQHVAFVAKQTRINTTHVVRDVRTNQSTRLLSLPRQVDFDEATKLLSLPRLVDFDEATVATVPSKVKVLPHPKAEVDPFEMIVIAPVGFRIEMSILSVLVVAAFVMFFVTEKKWLAPDVSASKLLEKAEPINAENAPLGDDLKAKASIAVGDEVQGPIGKVGKVRSVDMARQTCRVEGTGIDEWIDKDIPFSDIKKVYPKLIDFKEETLQDFLKDAKADQIFLVGEHRKPLYYKRLWQFISTEADLSRFGITKNDRLAAMLGDGPEAVVAFLAFSGQCVYCPINHKATDDEISYMLCDLDVKAVVLYRLDIGRCQGRSAIECTVNTQEAGLFTLRGPSIQLATANSEIGAPTKHDVALIIQTAGSTRKPKMVPITHENLILNGKVIADKLLHLKKEDRALNFLPLCHMGGIANNIIAPILTKSSVICAPSFTGDSAFNLLVNYHATWYFGTPTTHILMMRDQHKPQKHDLRLIRNAAAALLPTVFDEMSKFWTFNEEMTILPGYGITECCCVASHQYKKSVLSSSVGPAAGPEMIVENSGEIKIRGPCVFKGYVVKDRDPMEENPNSAFDADGWFSTGDCGWFNEFSYLSIIGRFKEVIVRGGEHISPFEVEDNMKDARITEKAAFSVSHEELGEVVGLAVKTRVTPAALGELLINLQKNTSLDRRKLPVVIVSMDEFPKGWGGRIKRIGLQKYLGMPTRSLNRSNPIAYTYFQGVLKEIECQVDEEDLHIQDSLENARNKRAVEIPPGIQMIVKSMYAIAVFGIVNYQNVVYLDYPENTPAVAITLMNMQSLSVPGGMRWPYQCLMVCASYLQCKEPISITRIVILILLYFTYMWPICPLIRYFCVLISGEPSETYVVASEKRWFVGVMIISYLSFCYFRNLPQPGLQCTFLALITLSLCIWKVNNNLLQDITPTWASQVFEESFVAGLYCWFGCITMYFLVGHYGHGFVARVTAHPSLSKPGNQRNLVAIAPILFIVCLFMMFSGPACELGRHLDSQGYTWGWDAFTIVMDQIVAFGMIALLSQSVRSVQHWLAPIGECALGIFLFAEIAYFLPHAPSMEGASFGIIIDKFQIIPTLQNVLFMLRSFWPLMVVFVFIYPMAQLFVFGLPSHRLYLKLVSIVEAHVKRMQVK